MKKLLSLILVLCLVLSFAACGAPADEGTADNEGTVEPMVWKLGDSQADDHPHTKSFAQFGEKLTELTGGQITVDLYPNSALGSHREMLESIQMGTLEITKSMSTDLSAYVPEAALFGLPYMFTSLEHMDACIDGGVKEWFNEKLAAYDLTVIAWLDAGSRSVYNSRRPVNVMADMEGLLLRVPENDVYMSAMAAFGATGTPMAMGEIYSALQSGVIDGAENAAAVLYSMKHYEVAKYFSLTEHIRTPDVLVMSKSYLEGLPQEIQDAVREAAAYLEDVERDNWAAYDDTCIADLEAGGTVINEVDKTEFIEASASVWEKFEDIVGADIIDLCASLS